MTSTASTASGAARLASNFRTSLNAVLAALFEPPCAACNAPLRSPLDGSVCATCWAGISSSPPLDERLAATRAITRMMSVGAYDGRMKDIIHALKYDRRRSISPRLGALMRERGADLLRGADAVVPVPLHPRRAYTRGFNQAHDLAIHLGLPVAPLLKRVVHTPSQIDLPRHQRLKNVKDAFVIDTPKGVSPQVSVVIDKPKGLSPQVSAPQVSAGVSILVLVDDVSTTGATLEACARVLIAAGIKEVRALTAARVLHAPR